MLITAQADSPLNCDCGNLIRNGDTRGYRSLAAMYTKIHASAGAGSTAFREAKGSAATKSHCDFGAARATFANC